jgi:thiosulfate/3-mercaptopyruvate sulfurtransferase
MDTLIAVDTLKNQLANPDLILFDCRFSLQDVTAGERAYHEGHLPGAHYANLNQDLSAPVVAGKTGRHPLPAPAEFAAWLRRAGVANTSMVVAYDDASGAFAARLWWMLRWLGHGRTLVLDGGFKAWVDAGFAITTDTPGRSDAAFAIRPPLTRVVAAPALIRFKGLLLDARDAARYRGDAEPIDALAGHIPGALCAPFADNLTPQSNFQPPAALQQRFQALGVEAVTDVVCYCGSGVTATHNILAMVHAGFPEPALYPGSWSEWITDPSHPVERG